MSYLIFMLVLILIISLAIALYVFICKNEELEEILEEKQSLINASRHSLAEAEEKISNMNYLMEFQRQKIDLLETQKKELVTNYDKAN